MNFFIYTENGIELNKPEILLVKEFADLFSLKFNANQNGDKDGRKRLKAFKVMQYIYLMYNWKSPYIEFSEQERYDTTLEDCNFDDIKVLESEEVIQAVRKYLDLQDTRVVRLLRSANGVVDKLRHYFDEIDLTERDLDTGKFVHSAKDVMSNLAAMGKTVESLKQLEVLVKKEQEQAKSLRADAEAGLFDVNGWE